MHTCIVLLVLILPASLIADYSATITMPANGEMQVNYMPTIIINTSSSTATVQRFDTTRITVGFPDCDTLIYPNTPLPTIALLKVVEDEYFDDSLDIMLTAHGDYTFNNTSIQFTPVMELEPNTKYVAKIKNLNVLRWNESGASWDTINASGHSITFTTMPEVHKIVAKNFMNEIRCNDTLKVLFNRALDSVATLSGELFTLQKLDSTSITNDTTWHYNFSNVSTIKWLNSDSTQLLIKIDSTFDNSTEFRYNINTEYLNGDSTTNIQDWLRFKKGMVVNLNVLVADSNYTGNSSSFTFPRAGTLAFFEGEDASLLAHNYDSNYVFNSWYSKDYDLSSFDKHIQLSTDFKTKYNLTYNVGSYPKGFKDGISIEANVSGIILAFATNPVIGAQILYIYESILKEVETASNNDYYGIGIYYSSWNRSWFGAHPTNGISGKAIQNADNKPVKTKFKIELYKSEDVGNDTKFEK